MRFGTVPVSEAEGAIAAHSVRLADGLIRKGTRLGAMEIERLRSGGVADMIVARLEPGDIEEDEAAAQLALAVAGEGVRVEAPFTGRANLFARHPGVLVLDPGAVDRVNEVDEAVTLATLGPYRVVAAGEMVGTVKIIPFAVPEVAVAAACDALAGMPPLHVAPFRPLRVGLVATVLPGLKESVIAKTRAGLERRLRPAGVSIAVDRRCPHEIGALVEVLAGLARQPLDLVVVFGASAITDRRDVIPAAIVEAGGHVVHLGMPVDPGNLLLLADLDGRAVIGAPGCARSPKENGFDWVLQRLLAGVPVGRAEIMGMGVGGLLMETVERGQPRGGPAKGGEA